MGSHRRRLQSHIMLGKFTLHVWFGVFTLYLALFSLTFPFASLKTTLSLRKAPDLENLPPQKQGHRKMQRSERWSVMGGVEIRRKCSCCLCLWEMLLITLMTLNTQIYASHQSDSKINSKYSLSCISILFFSSHNISLKCFPHLCLYFCQHLYCYSSGSSECSVSCLYLSGIV